jgi:hypothetical protein
VDDVLNVEGGFWATTSAAARSELCQCCCVVLCDTRRRDVGTPYTLHIDAAVLPAALGASLVDEVPAPQAMKFMVLTQIALPIEPNGGRHVYSFRLEGSHVRFIQ